MRLLITRETRTSATVQLTGEEWASIRFVLRSLRGGIELSTMIDAAHASAPAWMPFRVTLTTRQLSLLEAAAARLV